MGRKKKKKNYDNVIYPQVSENSTAAPEICSVPADLDKKPEDVRQNKCCSVALSTCMAGMFLCLVLGLYLGSLIPGIMNDFKQSAQVASPSQPPQTSQAIEQTQPQGGQGAASAFVQESGSLQPGRDINAHMGHLEKEVAQNPGNNAAWIELGNLYFDTSQYKLAIQAYEHSLSLEPNNPDVLTDLGIMYRETKNFAKAVECFRKASSLDPNHQNSLFNEGIVLSVDLHNKEEAKKAWTKLLQLNPNAHAPNGVPLSEMIRKLQ